MAVAAAFWPVLDAEFVNWDDTATVLDNPHIRSLSPSNLQWMFTTTFMGPYQPLSWLSLALDYRLGGPSPRVFHTTNLVLHALTTLIVFATARRILSLHPHFTSCAGACQLGAIVAALAFGIHPLRCESVCWVTERRDVLSGIFAFLTIYHWLGWTHQIPPHRQSRYFAALLCFVLALLSKATVVTFPLLLLILDCWPAHRLVRIGWRRALLEKVPFAIAALFFAVVAIAGQREANALLTLSQHGLTPRTIVALYSPALYLWNTLVPLDLYPIYTMPSPTDLVALRYIAPAVGIIALTIGALLVRAFAAPLRLAWVAFLVILLPVCGIVHAGPQIAADRYTYLATIPFAFLAGGGCATLVVRWPTFRVLIMIIIFFTCALLGVLTHRQSSVWRTSDSLWARVLELDSTNRTAHDNLADLWVKRALAEPELDKAVDQLRKGRQYSLQSIRIRPSPWNTYNAAVAEWLLAERQPDHVKEYMASARAHLQAMEDLSRGFGTPISPAGHLLYARVQREFGDIRGAIAHATEAVELVPTDIGVRRLLGELYLAIGDPLALPVLRAVAQMAPLDGAVVLRYAQALEAGGLVAEASLEADKAVRLLQGVAMPTAEEQYLVGEALDLLARVGR